MMDWPHRLSHGLFASALAALVAICATTPAAAQTVSSGVETIMACRIDGQDREASVSLAGNRVTYRYGPPQGDPEITLSAPLGDLDYRRADAAGDTIDEIVTFANGDTTYRLAMGFRDGAQPDPTALRPFGLLTVGRGGKVLARLSCRSDSIQRRVDRLLTRMRESGRERTSDGVTFNNYPVHPETPAAQSPACQADSNVDTCWSRGVSAARRGDLRGAIEHYDMSCDARIGTMGCYEAGKLYLHNRQLRDYTRAKQRLARTCDGDDPGQGPYACKYLGWMYLTGTGVERDLGRAFGTLAQACFLHNEAIMIDPEGCHFLGRTALEQRARSSRGNANADYIAYLAFAQACTDGADTVCEEAKAFYQAQAARKAGWIARCDRDAGAYGDVSSCAGLARKWENYDAAQAARKQLASLFRVVSTAME